MDEEAHHFLLWDYEALVSLLVGMTKQTVMLMVCFWCSAAVCGHSFRGVCLFFRVDFVAAAPPQAEKPDRC